MNRHFYSKIFAIAFLLIFACAGCLPTFSTPAAPVIQTVVVTQVITQEVTRIVEVPVTITATPPPLATDTPAFTPTETIAPTGTALPGSVGVTVLVHTQCLYGPDPAYISKYEILAGSLQAVIGRSLDNSWLYVQGADHKDPCWLKAELVKVVSGNVTDMPVTDPVLSPYSKTYTAPQAVSTNRIDNDVTIFWMPIPMTEQDYNGYLIEAWVCQGGQLVFVPRSFVPSYSKNSAMMAVKVTDEPGCSQSSSARIYTVSKEGYSNYKVVPWQPWVTPTPTLTPTPAS